ncbi:hypothetical protein SAMN04489844_4102 [Nocardioides exalbidus]|uniref:Shikimate kinase n=1 Tax=Nocardioides exalbidus TaxID=402596 RepID=A0A1H4ZHM1_9ACTN|nr:hypothetical protein SAMN04489844_4102 [Nocardioides exalbidus]
MGTALSERLGLPLIDKDAILEALFDSLGCPDRDERHRLSRASDEVLYALAAASQAAVVVNWWDHRASPARLRGIASSIVEVFCECPVEVATARFAGRSRHPGHHDPVRSPDELAEGVRAMREAFRGPLRVGELVRVDTEEPLDADSLAGQVLALLEGGRPRA